MLISLSLKPPLAADGDAASHRLGSASDAMLLTTIVSAPLSASSLLRERVEAKLLPLAHACDEEGCGGGSSRPLPPLCCEDDPAAGPLRGESCAELGTDDMSMLASLTAHVEQPPSLPTPALPKLLFESVRRVGLKT